MKADLVLADPAWCYNSRAHHQTRFRGGACGHYDLMKTEAICALPVRELASENAILFLWACWPMLLDALKVVEAWGFEFKTLGFCWVKTNPGNGGPFFGVGYYTKCLTGDSRVYLWDEANGRVLDARLDEAAKLDLSRHLIHTPDGWKRIRGLAANIGTRIVTFQADGTELGCSEDHRLIYKRPYQPREAGEKRTPLHRMDCGTATEIEERWRSPRGEVNGINLLYCTRPVESPAPLKEWAGFSLTPEMGWLLGLFCAEGNYGVGSASNQIRFTLHSEETEYIARLTDTISGLGLKGDRYFNMPVSVRTHRVRGKNCTVAHFSSRAVKEWIGSFIWGEGAHGKRLNHSLFLQTPAVFRGAFLDGFLAGDGFKGQGKYQRASLCNLGLVRDLGDLCRSLGQPTRIRSAPAPYQSGCSEAHTLSFIYSRCPGLLTPDQARASGRGSLAETDWNLEPKTVQPIGIREVEHPAKLTTTYDLEVDGHLFVVNGIISHNSNSEPCLLATRGQVLKPAVNTVSQVIVSPRGEHSAKPQEAIDRIDAMYPDLKKIELFARQERPGWLTLGNGIDGRDLRESMADLIAAPDCSSNGHAKIAAARLRPVVTQATLEI